MCTLIFNYIVLCMRNEGYGTWSVYLCVCMLPCFLPLCATRLHRKQVHCFTNLILKLAIFVKVLRSKLWRETRAKKANMLMSTASPRPVFAALHTMEALIVTQNLMSNRESKAFIQMLPMQTAIQ